MTWELWSENNNLMDEFESEEETRAAILGAVDEFGEGYWDGCYLFCCEGAEIVGVAGGVEMVAWARR